MGIEVITADRAVKMIEFIKTHLDYPKDQLEKICNVFLDSIKQQTFKAYE